MRDRILKSEQNLSYLPNHRTPRTDSASPLGSWLSVLNALGCRGGTKASELIAPFAPLFLRPVLYFCALLDIRNFITTTHNRYFSSPAACSFECKANPSFVFHWRSEIEKAHCANPATSSIPPVSHGCHIAHHIHHSNTW